MDSFASSVSTGPQRPSGSVSPSVERSSAPPREAPRRGPSSTLFSLTSPRLSMNSVEDATQCERSSINFQLNNDEAVCMNRSFYENYYSCNCLRTFQVRELVLLKPIRPNIPEVLPNTVQ